MGLYYYLFRDPLGDSDSIGNWTMKQTEPQSMCDGFGALDYIIVTTGSDDEAKKAMGWYMRILGKIEDWPADRVLADRPGYAAFEIWHWTTRDVVLHAFLTPAEDAYYKRPRTEEFLQQLKPDDKHSQWVADWEQCLGDLARWRKEAQKRAAEK
jgi:hypothetical protein